MSRRPQAAATGTAARPKVRKVTRRGSATATEKGSRFLGLVEPVADSAAVTKRLAELEAEHRNATHICWASRLGRPAEERSSDDGEPRGTAGQPILQRLQSADVIETLAIVIRWYGGTKLGRGGLIRAYGRCAGEALSDSGVSEVARRCELQVRASYDLIGKIKRLVRPPHIQLNETYRNDSVDCHFLVEDAAVADLTEQLARLGLTARVTA